MNIYKFHTPPYSLHVKATPPHTKEFATDDEAFEYANGCDDFGKTVVEKMVDDVWCQWDSTTSRWVSLIWKAEAVELFDSLCNGVKESVRADIQKMAECFAGESNEVSRDNVTSAVNSYLRGLKLGGA